MTRDKSGSAEAAGYRGLCFHFLDLDRRIARRRHDIGPGDAVLTGFRAPAEAK